MNGRVIGIFAAVLLVVGGGLFYFVRIYQPAQRLADARDEITAWETRWKAARDCLLGPSPGSSKTSEALAIRELSPDPWDRSSCTPKISKLNRGDAPNTGIDQVEKAWEALDKAAGQAAEAFATHVGTMGVVKNDPLPGALDALDAARQSLRAAAKMPVETAGGQPLAAAQVLPLRDGSDPVVGLGHVPGPAAHGLVVTGNTASHDLQITLAAGATPVVARLAPASLRGVPDAGWSAVAHDYGADAGAADADGKVASPTALPQLAKPSEGAADLASPGLLAALGTLDRGEVLYGFGGKLALVHLQAGKPSVETMPIALGYFALDADGRAAVAWSTPDHKVLGRIVKPGADEPVVDLPPLEMMSNGAICLTTDRAWLGDEGTLIAFGGGKPVAQGAQGAWIVGCTPHAAVARNQEGPGQFFVCTETCQPTTSPKGAPDSATLALVGGKLVAIAAHAGVIGVWHDDGTKTFYAVPGGGELYELPALALSDDKVIDLLVRGDAGYEVVRLPLTGHS